LATIRRATLQDAARLSVIARQTFEDTFASANTSDDMERHSRSSYGEAIQAIEIADPRRATLLGESEGRLVGFAQLRWDQPPSCVVGNAPGEIQRLYVVREFHGKGVAQELMRASIDEMKRRGSDVVWLGVWERNTKAIAFYAKCGFHEVGEHTFQLGSDAQRDIIMARAVVDRG
jgi:ribosomal protein S18 acetylase RimI-like enzyme